MPPDLVLCVGSVLVVPGFLLLVTMVCRGTSPSSTPTVHTAFSPLGREDALRAL
jgi:hypothetical protein